MFPIHFSSKLARVTKIPHYTAQRIKHQQQQQQRRETASESRQFHTAAELDFQGLPHTPLARFIATRYQVLEIAPNLKILLHLYTRHYYPAHYYAASINPLFEREEPTYSGRLFVNRYALRLRQRHA